MDDRATDRDENSTSKPHVGNECQNVGSVRSCSREAALPVLRIYLQQGRVRIHNHTRRVEDYDMVSICLRDQHSQNQHFGNDIVQHELLIDRAKNKSERFININNFSEMQFFYIQII